MPIAATAPKKMVYIRVLALAVAAVGFYDVAASRASIFVLLMGLHGNAAHVSFGVLWRLVASRGGGDLPSCQPPGTSFEAGPRSMHWCSCSLLPVSAWRRRTTRPLMALDGIVITFELRRLSIVSPCFSF
ncbi:hypothetical protein KXD40_006041 [Peronospora effusa]|nr:hypothetical protein KXD40_006041 [Peronospora effusa]